MPSARTIHKTPNKPNPLDGLKPKPFSGGEPPTDTTSKKGAGKKKKKKK